MFSVKQTDNNTAMTNQICFLLFVTVLASISPCKGRFVPRQPIDVLASDVTGSSVMLSWTSNPVSEKILFYVIKYRSLASHEDEGYREITGITTNTFTVTDLNPNTEYEFSIIPVNEAGRGAPSLPLVVPLLIGDLGSPPRNVHARPLSSNSIVIQWDPPKEYVGEILAYKVFYTTNISLDISVWDTQQVSDNRLTTINHLTPRTVYAIMIQAITIYGAGHHSYPVQVKTQRGVPSQPSRIVFTSITFTSIELNWSKPSHDGYGITGYEIYWYDSYTEQEHHKRLNDTNSHTIKGLHSDTLYSIWVAAKTDHGDGAPTPPVQVRTDHFVPSRPRKFNVKTINTTALMISWKQPLNRDRKGLIEGYHIYLNEVNDERNGTDELKRYVVEDEQTTEYMITDLQPSTRYYVHIAAATRKSDGAPTNSKIVRTAGGVPSIPKLRVRWTHGQTNFIVEVSWHRPLHINGELKKYRMIYGRSDLFKKEEMKEQELDPRTEKQTIHHLDHGAPYAFYLTGGNDNGWGQEASAFLKTPESVPHAAPENLTHRLLGPNSAKTCWFLPPLKYRNGEIIQYGVVFHKALQEHTSEIKTSETCFVLSNLEEGTEYFVRVRAYTEVGAGPPTNRIVVTTPRYVLPSPTDIFAAASSEDTAQVTWKWDPEPYLVEALGFQVLYTTDPVVDLEQWNQKTVPFTFSAELTGLELYARYAIKVAVITAIGLGKLSPIETMQMDPTDVPTNLRAIDVNMMNMSLLWGRPSKLDPIRYQVSYSAYKEFYDADGKLQKLYVPSTFIKTGSNMTQYTLYDLMPFTSYHINVTAIALDRRPRPPAKIVVTTAMAAPKPMAKPIILGTGGEISVILPKVSEEYGPISNYDLLVVPEDHARGDLGDYSTPGAEVVALDYVEPYITARFPYGSVPVKFSLGDGKVYGTYVNRRLQHDREYRVFARAVLHSPLKNLYTSSPLSDLISWDITYPTEGPIEYRYNDIPGSESPMCKSNGFITVDLTSFTLRILCSAAVIVLSLSWMNT